MNKDIRPEHWKDAIQWGQENHATLGDIHRVAQDLANADDAPDPRDAEIAHLKALLEEQGEQEEFNVWVRKICPSDFFTEFYLRKVYYASEPRCNFDTWLNENFTRRKAVLK